MFTSHPDPIESVGIVSADIAVMKSYIESGEYALAAECLEQCEVSPEQASYVLGPLTVRDHLSSALASGDKFLAWLVSLIADARLNEIAAEHENGTIARSDGLFATNEDALLDLHLAGDYIGPNAKLYRVLLHEVLSRHHALQQYEEFDDRFPLISDNSVDYAGDESAYPAAHHDVLLVRRDLRQQIEILGEQSLDTLSEYGGGERWSGLASVQETLSSIPVQSGLFSFNSGDSVSFEFDSLLRNGIIARPPVLSHKIGGSGVDKVFFLREINFKTGHPQRGYWLVGTDAIQSDTGCCRGQGDPDCICNAGDFHDPHWMLPLYKREGVCASALGCYQDRWLAINYERELNMLEWFRKFRSPGKPLIDVLGDELLAIATVVSEVGRSLSAAEEKLRLPFTDESELSALPPIDAWDEPDALPPADDLEIAALPPMDAWDEPSALPPVDDLEFAALLDAWDEPSALPPVDDLDEPDALPPADDLDEPSALPPMSPPTSPDSKQSFFKRFLPGHDKR